MEQNIQMVANKFWNMVRVAYFMLRKGISKSKLLADLSIMLKRRKIAGKLSAIQNLMFHHHHHHDNSSAATGENHSSDRYLSYPTPPNEYEFSCNTTPAHRAFRLSFHLNKRKHSHAPPPADDPLMAEALDIVSSAAASPDLPGFGRTPMARQLRVTDSPFPLREIDEDAHVDEAAEKFISKFYRDLRQQRSYLGY